jgi:hypothetical protein
MLSILLMAFEDLDYDFNCSNRYNSNDNGIPANIDLVGIVHALVFWVVYACHMTDGANDGGA